MKIEVKEDKKNPLLKRREIKFRAAYQGPTPKMPDVRKDLVAALKSDEKLTVVDNMKSEYGAQVIVGYVKVYENEAAMKIEDASRIKKNFGVKEEKKAEKAEEPAKKEE